MPKLLSPRARRTRRLAGAQGQVGVTCGGEAGTRLLRRLGMPTSADTMVDLLPDRTAQTLTEGQVNKLKLIKRQMYGCASFDLLHCRVLLAA